jgi:2-hydroxy-6-oxonona-2,4-dienedioate hydrolase
VSVTHNPISVVFLHGMFGAPENWRAALDALSPQCDVHAPFLPVFHTPSQREPVEFLVQEARDYLRAAQIRHAVLVGNSLGGHIALKLALLEPERVAGLVLSGSSGLFERGLEKNVPRRPSREWLRQKAAQVFFDERHVTEQVLDEIAAVVYDRRSALQLVRLAQSAKRDNLAACLPRVKVPTLLIWGENDQITPLETASQFYELLPNSKLETVPCCGHAAMLEQPEHFNRVLEGFVWSLAPSRKVLSIPRGTEQEEAGSHARQDHKMPAEVREIAAA